MPGCPARIACRAAPPPRYHSPSLASVNGHCMALTVTLNLTLTLTLTLALKLHSSSLFTEYAQYYTVKYNNHTVHTKIDISIDSR